MCIEILKDNLGLKEGTFYYKLKEKSKFDVGLYNQFVYSLIRSFDSVKDTNLRSQLSLEMWELFFLISRDLINHQNELDLYKIREIDQGIISTIINNLYEIGNFISWKKEIDFRDYFIS